MGLNLRLQKRLAASVMKCGKRRVWMDPKEANEIALANSRLNVRKLVKDGFIIRKPIKGHSRCKARRRLAEKKKGRHKGLGKRKGSRNARMPQKDLWIRRQRVLRRVLKRYREEKQINVPLYHRLYLKAKGNVFRNKRMLVEAIAKIKEDRVKGRILSEAGLARKQKIDELYQRITAKPKRAGKAGAKARKEKKKRLEKMLFEARFPNKNKRRTTLKRAALQKEKSASDTKKQKTGESTAKATGKSAKKAEKPSEPKSDKAAAKKAPEKPAKKAATKKPAASKTEKPAAPKVEKPAAKKPAADKPKAAPKSEKPAAKKPAADKPAAKSDKPAAKKAAAKPAAKKPAAEKAKGSK